MKNVVPAIFVTCVMSMAIGVAAQEQTTPGSQPGARTQQPATGAPTTDTQTGSRRQSAGDEKVTISGCIQNAPAEGATASAAEGGSKYVLGNAKMASGASRSSSVGTSGTTGAKSYRLEGEDKTISPHLNHQVEITGTVQNASGSSTGAAGAASGSAAAGPTLKVDSLKMVSTKCQ